MSDLRLIDAKGIQDRLRVKESTAWRIMRARPRRVEGPGGSRRVFVYEADLERHLAERTFGQREVTR